MKKQINFRACDKTQKRLKEMQAATELSQTDLILQAIKEKYEIMTIDFQNSTRHFCTQKLGDCEEDRCRCNHE